MLQTKTYGYNAGSGQNLANTGHSHGSMDINSSFVQSAWRLSSTERICTCEQPLLLVYGLMVKSSGRLRESD